ncbi:MAG: putative aminohydrolase SsnA [candidate division KSB1 bacterium]|nr:putative aminohydrolase SsnA [candidate division KSB1 bacterium]MDZ7276366.1 putative aminohydrolase SsnA [candidate division KSB1 bacterium]MDZ7287682.1 putative aminohydrolase SsnA [candidate division KSB1 bacterium]MDZ7299978.1 putative aminohydrolase SsnA [candidate division KSB1 bacterium]MDZ7307353.1 putative aminohydrolase SsnA [candidate division KSB1 bacterium]
MKTLIHNATIFTNTGTTPVLTAHTLVIDGARIAEILPESEARQKHPRAAIIDAGGRLLMPGLINAHMHFYSTFARGLAPPVRPRNFAEVLRLLWWKLDASLDEEAVYYSTLLAAASAVKHGVTAVIDHHASPNAIAGSLDCIEEALALVGMRGVLCYEITDRNGRAGAQAGLRENERYLHKCRHANNESTEHLFDAMVGLHASFTVADDTLQAATALSRAYHAGCHVHVLEDPVDQEETRARHGRAVVDRLQSFGILGPQTLAAHCIHLAEQDRDILAHTQTLVAHNPQSNMNNAVGRADIFRLLERGVTVGIGTDGMSAALWPDLRTAILLHKHDLRDCNAGWREIQHMALRGNPAIFQHLTGKRVGEIAPGSLADLILIDYYPATTLTPENFWGHLLYGLAEAAVDTTIINGKVVVRNGRLLQLDERELAAAARPVAQRVWQRFYE